MDAELLPSITQTLWGRLAVANFFLGGAGAGAYLVAVALAGIGGAPIIRWALMVGPLLVLAGFLSVGAEAGRPLRGPRVLRMVSRSWMSRESWAAGAFVGAAVLDGLRPWAGWRLLAALAALVFVLAQGVVLGRCRAVAAWNVPLLPPLFLGSSLVSGAAVLGLVAPFVSPGAERLAIVTAGLIVLSGLLWIAYGIWPGDPAFRTAVATFSEDSVVLGVFVVGHALPLVLLVVGLRSPAFAAAALVLAGIGILLGHLRAKAWLILRAGTLRPITLAGLTLTPSPSPLPRRQP